MAPQQKSAGKGVRLLSVVWYKVLPPRFGGQKGVALFNEHLGRLLPLHCLCAKNNEAAPASYTIEATLPVSKTQFINPLSWLKIYQTCRRQHATHLLLEFPYHGIAGVLCQALLGVKLVVHAHNIEHLRFKALGKWWWKALYWLERWAMRRADAVFFKTEKDQQTAITTFQLQHHQTHILPFGLVKRVLPDKRSARAEICRRHNVSPAAKLLLFTGTLDYEPNAEAVEALAKKLLPLLKQQPFTFHILFCGRIIFERFTYLKDLQNEHLHYAGDVVDIETYLAAADVFLNPVLTGGGVQTKMVDALQADLNVVCFEGMTEGITGAGEKLFAVPRNDWQAFADATVHAATVQRLTPPLFFNQHDWTNIAAKAGETICNL